MPSTPVPQGKTLRGTPYPVDFEKDQVVHLPKGDASKAEFFCRSADGKPNKDGPCKRNAPFHLSPDQQDRIWITNALGDTVTRFSASDPSKVEVFSTGGHSGKGMAIDSQGNVWITNTMGTGLDVRVKLRLLELKLTGRMSEFHRVVFDYLNANPSLGSISMLRPDGTPVLGSPFHAGGAWGSWGVVIDGNDQVWSSNFAGQSITHLCGVRTETCPPGIHRTPDRECRQNAMRTRISSSMPAAPRSTPLRPLVSPDQFFSVGSLPNLWSTAHLDCDRNVDRKR